MKMSKAQLELLKKRGGTVVAKKKKAAEKVEEKEDKKVEKAESKAEEAKEQAYSTAVLLSSEATLTAVEQVKELAKSISDLLNARSKQEPEPVSYRFSVKRGKDGKMTEILAVPVAKGIRKPVKKTLN